MYSYEYLQFLNDRILEYLPADRVVTGDKINFRCPICGDSHKSVTKKRGFWYTRNASYYCFNCGVGMSGIRFLQVLSGHDYEDIKREFVKLFLKSGLDNSLSAQFSKPETEPGFFDLKSIIDPAWKKPLSDDAREYLKKRHVDGAPFLKDDLFSYFDKTGREYILIPWVVNGVDAYFQLNDFKKHGPIKYIFPKNRKKLVYGLDNIDLSYEYIYIFEGVYDSLFVKNGVATGSKSITDYQLKLIKERYPSHKICVAFDNDTPGITSMTKLIDKGVDFKYFKWFDRDTKEKDINEYVIAKNDISLFSNPDNLRKMTVSSLQMKFWLAQNGKILKLP